MFFFINIYIYKEKRAFNPFKTRSSTDFWVVTPPRWEMNHRTQLSVSLPSRTGFQP